ncbi:hypothetical protein QUA42_02605 [Microcoleus sp. Pol11C2]
MFDLKLLQQKSLKDLKEIGERLNCLPDGDRRLRRNWIAALASFPFPETSPGVEPIEQAASIDAEPTPEPIKVQAQEPKFQIGCKVRSLSQRWGIEKESLTGTIVAVQHSGGVRVDFGAGGCFDFSRSRLGDLIEVQAQEPPLESKFGSIVYPRPAAKSEAKVSQSAIAPVLDVEEFRRTHVAEIDSYFESVSKNPPGSDLNPILTTADAWNNAEFGEVLHAAEPSGQLNLLEWEDTNEPPEPDDYPSIADFDAAYDRWLLNQVLIAELETKTQNATTKPDIARNEGADIRYGRSHPAELDGDISSAATEGLGNQEGDRVLAVAGNHQAVRGRDLPDQPTQLAPIITPQAPIIAPQAQSHDSQIKKSFDEQQPPGRGDGRGCYAELAIGMLVGRRSDRQHIGKILDIYKSRRGIWRAKIQPLNKPNFVYFDCAALIEQRLLYDYEMKPGRFLLSGETFDKSRGEKFEVYSHKVRSAKPTNWTADELNSLSTFKLKQIAREMEIPAIPGSAGKRSLIRAILAEQAISQEKAAAQRERETTPPTARKQKSAPASKKKGAAVPLGNQLSLFDVAV